MEIRINIENKSVEIFLLDGEIILDKAAIEQEYGLSEELLPKIDELLTRNKLRVRDVDEMNVKSDMGENFTTYRIAMATANAFNWGKNLI